MSRLPRLGITESLTAPGLAVPPPVSSEMTKLDQLRETLGLAGGVALGVAQLNRAQAIRAEQDAEKADDAFRGQASLDFRTRQAQIAADIKDRKIVVPEGVTPTEYAQTLADQETAGFPDQYRTHYDAVAVPRLAELLVAQRESIKAEAKEDDIRLRTEAIVQATTAEEMTRIANDAAGIYNLSQTDKLSLLIPSLRSAASNADAGRFAAAKAAIGDALPLERDAAQAVFDRETARVKAEKQRAVVDHIQGQINAGAPVDQVEQLVRRMSLRGELDQSASAPIYNALKAQKERMALETEENRIKAFEIEVKSAYEQDAVAASLGADKYGGGLYMLQDREIPIPGTDKTLKLDAQKTAQAVTDKAMASIAAAHPNDPGQALARQVEFVANNKVVPTAWNALLNNADTGASIDQIVPVRNKDGGYVQPPTAPANLLAAFGLYKQISVQNPRVARDSVRNASAELLYDTAEFVESLPEYGESNRALLAAARSINAAEKRPSQQREIVLPGSRDNETGNLKSVKGFEDGDNQQYVYSWIVRAAEFYRNIDGVSDTAAIDRAKARFESVHTLVNGNYVYTRGVNVPKTINAASEQAAKLYVNSQVGGSAGPAGDPNDYVLIPDGQNGWELKRKVGDYYMELPNPAFYTNRDLDNMVKKMSAEEQAAAESKAVKRNLRNRSERELNASGLGSGFNVHRDD